MDTCAWTSIVSSDELKRSSHTVSVVEAKAYVFGGELLPRQPKDNLTYLIDLISKQSHKDNIKPLELSDDVPGPRVGSASTAMKQHIYMFSGRGGDAMTPIEEDGSLWQLDTNTQRWATLSPAEGSKPYPSGRSYHTMASDGEDSIFVHAGCPTQGRLSDLWSFSVSKRTWTRLADAPEPARGGTSIAFSGGLLYRMNGFDGNSEQGGSLDVYNPANNSWASQPFAADSASGPVPRSVSALLALKTSGKPCLVTLFGERDPSSLGHQGAGKMLDDIWIYDIGSKTWREITIDKSKAATSDLPSARGWFDADVVQGDGNDKILVVGGLGESNERLDDAWLLSF